MLHLLEYVVPTDKQITAYGSNEKGNRTVGAAGCHSLSQAFVVRTIFYFGVSSVAVCLLFESVRAGAIVVVYFQF